jgi:hypothetical protein
MMLIYKLNLQHCQHIDKPNNGLEKVRDHNHTLLHYQPCMMMIFININKESRKIVLWRID